MEPTHKTPTEIFVKEKPVMALLVIYEAESEIYPSKVSKAIDSTYSHTVKIISKMEEQGIVETEKQGRKRLLKLTELGNSYAEILLKLVDLEDGFPYRTQLGRSYGFFSKKDSGSENFAG
ncbi:winged helix-turn-helix domain-containing protein [Candidatus Nanohalococcus occultus]|uniref:Transcriptional regulator, contains HTH domain n=1 Tax=Candidatus Nanohalococcus occultus TaxID=2978047 RepID=A0ABY8CF08_9ARCH|nr:Transcriptional regulator, contains HTH domain [Candidatus Nanohaloarchaeota archaeon SVXNc]